MWCSLCRHQRTEVLVCHNSPYICEFFSTKDQLPLCVSPRVQGIKVNLEETLMTYMLSMYTYIAWSLTRPCQHVCFIGTHANKGLRNDCFPECPDQNWPAKALSQDKLEGLLQICTCLDMLCSEVSTRRQTWGLVISTDTYVLRT